MACAEIEQRLTSAGGQRHLNEISGLFELCEAEDLRDVASALQAIARVLVHHRRIAVEAAGSSQSEGKVGDELVAWLRKHGEAFHSLLLQLAGSGEPRAQACAIRLVMAAIRDEASEISASKGLRLDLGRLFGLHPPEKRMQDLLSELLLSERWSTPVADCLLNEFVKQFADVRHYVIGHIRSCAEQVGKSTVEALAEPDEASAKKRRRVLGPFADSARQRGRSHEEIFTRLLGLLREAPEPQAPAVPHGIGEEEEPIEDNILAATGRPAGHYRREYRRVFQEAWLKLLGLRVPLAHCSPLLQLLPSRVIPHISRPLMLSDFYLRAFHAGSLELSVLALSGLLLLLTTHGLGDPETLSASCGEFYAQLFSLLQPATFRLKRRARFQRLAAAALNSALLPSRFAAAFAKKCLRVAVACSEPGAIMWLISVAYGLIQRNHSHCSFLLSRPSEGAESATSITKDPFLSEAALSEAAVQVSECSAWEITLLLRHHLPAVATLAKLFEKPFFKPSSRKLDPELFLDQAPIKAYGQALKAADRQVSKWQQRGQRCPLAFKVEDDEEAMRVTGWAAALSTSQRRIGAGI
mmetsp:Transcript_101313/g.180065  ORF Transcript_101313/g.180065 Transcript_101313/m.180065 type:complete len:582 (-) Transcript_101313:112-1857(-)|eukprot:CAMPEP_0197630642 /NCGR_PEP_ID=MMETSP1338-20131121/8054_1 /TAXON_ID=43686 ORGANISM="Pelagodinium beii, Strain RCC1491" /NCGR_SAMPLE_ID=MMETSP1338 /ASSEMBLY_ACC=CAM_ASM_000754 /LENGTH=581 /DNA_ID=CAMNT_0043201899 /DNA_START=22 /DNA_END=1767 /DNA_ORIENTATION=-